MVAKITKPKDIKAKDIKAENTEQEMRKETILTIAQLDKTRLLLAQHTAEVLLMQQQMAEKEE